MIRNALGLKVLYLQLNDASAIVKDLVYSCCPELLIVLQKLSPCSSIRVSRIKVTPVAYDMIRCAAH